VRRSHARTESATAAANLTPLIDVVFLLLIFFVTTSSFVKESGVEVERPVAESAARQERGNILIGVTANGTIWVDGAPVALESVRTVVGRLVADVPQSSVVVVADRAAMVGLAVRVIDQVRLAGVRNVSIAARSP